MLKRGKVKRSPLGLKSNTMETISGLGAPCLGGGARWEKYGELVGGSALTWFGAGGRLV